MDIRFYIDPFTAAPHIWGHNVSEEEVEDALDDLWVAVCAIRHSVPLVTHNRKHFEGIPRLRVLSQAP